MNAQDNFKKAERNLKIAAFLFTASAIIQIITAIKRYRGI